MAKRPNSLKLLLNDDEAGAVAEYRWRNRVPSQTEAVRQLIAKGLEAEANNQPTGESA